MSTTPTQTATEKQYVSYNGASFPLVPCLGCKKDIFFVDTGKMNPKHPDKKLWDIHNPDTSRHDCPARRGGGQGGGGRPIIPAAINVFKLDDLDEVNRMVSEGWKVVRDANTGFVQFDDNEVVLVKE